jgi:peptidylprolyl isomerase
MQTVRYFLYIFYFLLLGTQMTSAQENSSQQDNIIIMRLKDGDVKIELLPEVAPNHVARIKQLASEGFYDGVVFHRVIEGFMAQTGDPTGTGMGGSKLPNLQAEFNTVSHVRGIVSMARAQSPDSANSQFFIVLADATYLDRQYTVFGRVIEGMEFVDKIKKGNSMQNGAVETPDKIIKKMLLKDFK